MATLPRQGNQSVPANVVQSQHRPEESAAELQGKWRKSSFSATAECLAVAEVGGEVVLWNSKGPGVGTLVLSRGGVAALVAGCKAGEFDDLTA